MVEILYMYGEFKLTIIICIKDNESVECSEEKTIIDAMINCEVGSNVEVERVCVHVSE